MRLSQKRKEFLLGLTKLTRKTGVIISGCGCCGSPYLDEVELQDPRAGYAYQSTNLSEVVWVEPADKVSKHVVRDDTPVTS